TRFCTKGDGFQFLAKFAILPQNANSLIIMRDHAQSLRGDCQVRRRETGGTEVIVTFIPEKTFSIQ
ncbi:hypothetical protein AAGO31_24310, partial [Klebsiella pneumoniae]